VRFEEPIEAEEEQQQQDRLPKVGSSLSMKRTNSKFNLQESGAEEQVLYRP